MFFKPKATIYYSFIFNNVKYMLMDRNQMIEDIHLPDPMRAQIRTMELYFISGALLSSASSLCKICTSLAFSRSFSAVSRTGND